MLIGNYYNDDDDDDAESDTIKLIQFLSMMYNYQTGCPKSPAPPS